MALTFLNGLLLAGLAALVIPPIIHLLNRKRFEVVPWGAMQFLQPSERTRRRVFLEELLLMLVRMGLIAVMVLALAAPVATSPMFSYLGAAGPRDVVLVIDGSYSMDYRHDGKTAHDAAKESALAFLDDLAAGAGVAVLPPDPPNWAVTPLRPSRAVAAAGQTITFRTALTRHGTGELAVPHVRLEVDGRPAGDVPVTGATGEKGQLPLTVRHRFPAAG